MLEIFTRLECIEQFQKNHACVSSGVVKAVQKTTDLQPLGLPFDQHDTFLDFINVLPQHKENLVMF